MDNQKLTENITAFSAGALDVYLTSKGIPPLATIGVAGIAASNSIIDRFFRKKAQAFFKDFESLNKKEIKELCDSLGAKLEEFWSNALQTIAKLDSEDKAKICNKLLLSLIEKKISIADYLRLVRVVDNVYLDDIMYFNARFRHNSKPHERTDLARELEDKLSKSFRPSTIITNLLNAGLLREEIITLNNKDKTWQGPPKTKAVPVPTTFGDLMLDYGLSEP